ncbi:MAG: TIGR00296 family protein [Nitrospiraceae bacterium]|nr:TIGR00296 family protein [Nitrospiraceae bacterium]
MLSDYDGETAVKYARAVVENHVGGRAMPDFDFGEVFNKKMGAFVTLNTYPEKELRGCIGIPEPIMPLKDAIHESAVSATRDPRFPPLGKNELDGVVVEVTALTPPELIEVESPDEYLSVIKVGRDGLIAERGFWRGLLLPQVPVEYGWDVGQFLSQTCVKAGLPPDAWSDGETKIYRFQGEVFSEIEPYGTVERVM